MVEELIGREIYWSDNPNEYIFKTNDNGLGYTHYIYQKKIYRKENEKHYKWKGNIRIATPQEKTWLNACIKANKFIPMNEVNYNVIHEIW